MAHLVVTVQGHHHAFFQVVQRNGLQDVQVVGHLVLDGARTVDDVLKNNTITIINSPNHRHLYDVQYKENEFKMQHYFVNVLTEILLIHECKYFLERQKRRLMQLRVSATRWRHCVGNRTMGAQIAGL